MAKVKQNNFGRFYCLIKGRPEIDKELMVHQFTDGRTTHLREMYREEYEEMCDAIEGKQRETSSKVQLKDGVRRRFSGYSGWGYIPLTTGTE